MNLADRRTLPALRFLLAAAAIYLVTYSVSRLHATPTVALACLCDLTLTVPALFYWLLVRSGVASWASMAGVSLAGARLAWILLPASLHGYLPATAWLAIPLEVWVLAMLLRRGSALHDSWAGRLARSEVEVLYFALFAWRARPEERPGWRAYPCRETSGYGMFCMLLGLVLVLEGVPVHLALRNWNPAAAWVFGGLEAYAFLWIIGVARSLRLRPVLVSEDAVLFRIGILWSVEFTKAQIARVWRVSGDAPKRGSAGYLRLTAIARPQWVIEFRDTVTACGPLGIRRQVSRLGVALDRPGAMDSIYPVNAK